MTTQPLLGELTESRSSNAPGICGSVTCSCASSHQMRGLPPHHLRASACQCSGVSPASALLVLHLLACTYPTSPRLSRTESLGHPSCDGESCWPTSGSSSTPLLTNCPPLQGGYSPCLSCQASRAPCLRPGRAPRRIPASACGLASTVSELHCPPCLLCGPIIPCDFERKLFSMVSFNESKPC